ncbi:MAG: ATP-binding protein [Oscillospiraceae bacterium]|nr:ATP-binding protein [Oscillospiraceae bacterium]
MDNELQTAISRIKSGVAPGHAAIVGDMTLGINFLAEFWETNYLSKYIPCGGNRIQFITGRQGSGKTHMIEYLLSRAGGGDSVGGNSAVGHYKIASFSARKIWVHDFKEIFFEVLRQCDLEDCLSRCAREVVKSLGFDPNDFDGRFIDYLASKGQNDPITKREIRLQLNQMFLHNPLIDNNFACACALLTGGQLGHPLLEEPAREALLGWLSGRKDVKLAFLRSLGLSPVRIAKNNARHMLRSLVEVVKMAGYDGVIIAVDDLDILVSSDSMDEIRYTRLKREDAYESLRELIDEIDTLRNVFFLFAFDRKLIDDDKYGVKSYQALWFRMQNEIRSERINRFSNMIDLDKLPVYDVRFIMELSARVARLVNTTEERPAQPLDEGAAVALLSKAGFGEIALPRKVILATIGQKVDE